MPESELQQKLQELIKFKENASIKVHTLGQFLVYRNDKKIDSKNWGRDKTVQLFQYLVSNRQRHALHREKIMESLWEDGDDRDFKVALHGIHKVLEPERPSRTEPSFVIRQGISYQLAIDKIWIDVAAIESYIIIGNEALGVANDIAIKAYKLAIELYNGEYLPNRVFEDWSSEEREKTQLLILAAFITLAELLINENPLESIRLAQNALSIDATWEDAYRLQMQAYLAKGNRPQAIKTYQKCVAVLDAEYGIDPLPETQKLMDTISGI